MGSGASGTRTSSWPFNQRGGLGKVHQLFGAELPKVIEAMNRELAA
jgi:type I restriction enzyme R subunit